MKKKAVAVLTAISILIASLTGCQTATKSYGGKTTIKLEPNQKLEEITWKDNSLWYLTRPMTNEDIAETHTFQQQSRIYDNNKNNRSQHLYEWSCRQEESGWD